MPDTDEPVGCVSDESFCRLPLCRTRFESERVSIVGIMSN